jgi:hypothetical protein
VLVACGPWRYLAQWDAGMPNLWPVGLGHGLLTIVRIKRETYVNYLVSEASRLEQDA